MLIETLRYVNLFENKICLAIIFTYFYLVKQSETYLTTKEVGELLKVSRTTVHRLVKEKTLKPRKIGRANRYKLSDIEKVMK